MTARASSPLRLAGLFHPGGLLDDLDGDGLPEIVRGLIVLASHAGPPEQRATVDLAARLGFESLALQLPIATLDLPEDTVERIPIFLGRPSTLSPGCPRPLADLLATLEAGQGLIALAPVPQSLMVPVDENGRPLSSLSASSPRLRVSAVNVASPSQPVLLVGGADERGLAAATQALVAGDLAGGVPFADLPAGVEAMRFSAHDDPERGANDDAHETALPPLRSLADIFGPAGLAVDGDGDLLPDRPRVRLVLPDDLSPGEAVAAAHLGAWLGLESLGVALPLAVAGDHRPLRRGEVQIRMEPLTATPRVAAHGAIRLATLDDGQIIRIAGDVQGREAALELLVGLDAWVQDEQRPMLEAVERTLGRLCALADPGAALCAVLPALRQLPPLRAGAPDLPLDLQLTVPASWQIDREAVAGCLRGILSRLELARDATVRIETARPEAAIDETQTLDWEVDEAWRLFRSEVLPHLATLPADTDWFLDLRLSEPEGRRRAHRQELLEEIRNRGVAADAPQVRVLPAYHQGRGWLLEEVLPQLRALPVAALLIRVQRFAPEIPSLELPIRWLQDLFPVDELLADRLGIPSPAIRFELVDDLPTTYEVEAYDDIQGVLLRRTFDAVYAARPYLRAFPDWGAVHPPTGCLRLAVGDTLPIDLRLATDPERVWDHLQGDLLPRLTAAIMAASGGEPRRERQPFFAELAIDVWLSEEDEPLGIRQERSSPLESLHEDLYFTILDHCAALISAASDAIPYLPPWMRPTGADKPAGEARSWTAPGSIVPRIHRRDGAAGRVQMRLTPVETQPALHWRRGDAAGDLPLVPASGVTVRIVGIDVGATGAPGLVLALDGPDEACEQARGILAGWGALQAAGVRIAPDLVQGWAYRLDGMAPEEMLIHADAAGGATTVDDPPAPARSLASADAAGTEVPWDRVLGSSEIERIVRRLGRYPEIRAFRAGRSSLGRPIWALEVTVPRTAGWWSRAKLSGWKCTLLLIGRHHGNEPASTNALLRLAELLATDEVWRRYLRRVNVVLIPCENADGMDLHYELADEHPTWMHHAARYNASGVEFGAAYTVPHTPHTEALVLPQLWRRWAPDIFCDNHGFPAHVWEQPFAGHGNPWYRAFWLPQALIYAYLPVVRSPRFPDHPEAVAAIGARLVDALAADPLISPWNARHAERYRAFLHQWLPHQFPAAYERDVLLHHSSYDPDDANAGLAGFPGLYPGVTTASLVTEVADETGQGTYLALCAHAHLQADRALLQYLFDAGGPSVVRRESRRTTDGRTLLSATRPRPARASPPR